MVIYTKKGDKGRTLLFNEKRLLSKNSTVIRAIGAIDEANSYLGIISSEIKNNQATIKNQIIKIQKDFFIIGAILAGVQIEWKSKRPAWPAGRVEELEKEIDRIEKKLPPLKNFILPGGSLVASRLMYARALVRRAEREASATKYKQVLPYLNRLSDYLFILARLDNFQKRIKEIDFKI